MEKFYRLDHTLMEPSCGHRTQTKEKIVGKEPTTKTLSFYRYFYLISIWSFVNHAFHYPDAMYQYFQEWDNTVADPEGAQGFAQTHSRPPF